MSHTKIRGQHGHNTRGRLTDFYVLWATQSLSQLGSAITEFALTLWLYDRSGSALSTAALTVCTYAPYVLVSVFAGAVIDRLDKRHCMLVADALAALTTCVLALLHVAGMLEPWHLYVANIVSGLMNTVQQPASEVAYTLITPKEDYQRTSGLKSLSRSLITVASPLLAAPLYGLLGFNAPVAFDLATFAVAFVALARFVRIPEAPTDEDEAEGMADQLRAGLGFLRENPMVSGLIGFMAGVNFVASAFDATLPAYVLPNPAGGEVTLGIVTSCAGLAMLSGSLIVTAMPKPKDRVRVVTTTMLISLGIENFMLAFSRSPAVWCIGQVVGWMLVPVMSANLDTILRCTIPVPLQGRVYACRNTCQFLTIPLGMLFGGFMVDAVFEPHMAKNTSNVVLTTLFGHGKGSGAALMMLVLGLMGTIFCLVCGKRLRKYSYVEE